MILWDKIMISRLSNFPFLQVYSTKEGQMGCHGKQRSVSAHKVEKKSKFLFFLRANINITKYALSICWFE